MGKTHTHTHLFKDVFPLEKGVISFLWQLNDGGEHGNFPAMQSCGVVDGSGRVVDVAGNVSLLKILQT